MYHASTSLPFVFSKNPLDYDALIDKPLWLLYSYLAQLLDNVKHVQAAQATPGGSNDPGMTIKEFAQISGVSTPEMMHQGNFEAAVREEKERLGKSAK